MAVMFVLAYDFPTAWFVVDRGERVGATEVQGYVPAVLLLAGLFAVAALIHSPEIWVRMVALEPLLALFVMLAVVSTLWSDDPAVTLRMSLPLVAVVVLGYWMVAQFRLAEILLMLCAVLALGVLVQYVFIFGLPTYGQSRLGWSGTAPDKNVMGRLAVLAAVHFALAIGAFPRLRLFWGLMLAAAVGLVLGSTSATSLAGLGFVVALVVVVKVFRARKTLYGAVAVSMVGGGALGVFTVLANLEFVARLLGKDVTLTGRTILWEGALAEALKRPLFGHGWGAFWQGPLSPSRPILDLASWDPPHAHNALLDYSLTLGFVGAAIAVALFFRYVVRAARAVRYRPGTLGLWPLSYAGYAFIFSITEFGVISRSIFFLLLTIHISVAAAERRDRNPQRMPRVSGGTVNQPPELQVIPS